MIKYHNWPQIPHGKVTHTHTFNNQKRESRGQSFPSRWPQGIINRHVWKHNKHKTEITQMIHKRSTPLERSAKKNLLEGLTRFNGAPTSPYNTSDTEALFLEFICSFLMILFLSEFMIMWRFDFVIVNFAFKMAMFIALHPKEFTFLNSSDLLEQLAMLLTSTLAINC